MKSCSLCCQKRDIMVVSETKEGLNKGGHMQHRVLGKTGLNVSAVGFGGIPIQRIEGKEVPMLIDELVNQGINFIDTAKTYTVSESYLGEALKGKRQKFFLATKSPSKDYEGMKADIDASLKNLQTDFIDLYQCHLVKTREQYDQIMSDNGAYRALVEAKEAGKIGHIGITAHSVDLLLEVIEEMPFETLQFPYNMVERQGEPLFEKAKARNIGVIIMKPLAGGAIDKASLSIRFILENPNITVVIPGMEKVEQIIENAACGNEHNPLSDEERAIIESEAESLGSQFCRRCGYCMPCTQGIDIPTQFIIEGYYKRYHLEEWASERFKGQSISADDCIQCGNCEPRCPYNLPIMDMLQGVTNTFRD